MNKLDIENLINILNEIEDNMPQFNHEAIDSMIEQGNNISDLVMLHSIPELRDLDRIKTKHGYIKLSFVNSSILGNGTCYIVKVPFDYFSIVKPYK